MNMRYRRLTYSALLVIALLAAPWLQTTSAQPASEPSADVVIAIVGAMVIGGTGAEPSVQTVIIRGERIVAVGNAVEIPNGARIIRAEGMTLLPGLFDLHTHLPYATGGGVSGDWPKNLKAYLYSGVTSVSEFGTYPETFAPMRKLIANGTVAAPRISFAARFSTPDGHGAEGGRADIFTLEVLTPREARAAVRQVLPYRPDIVKVFTDGWRYGTAPAMSSMDEATLAALVDEAHQHGLEVLTHTVTLEKAKVAARAGVDVIAHGIGDTEVDAELIAIMKEKGTTYAPTLAVYEPRGNAILTPLLATVLDPAVRNAIRPPLTPPVAGDGTPEVEPPSGSQPPANPSFANAARTAELRRLRAQRWKYMRHNLGALHQAGVRVGVGTDAGVTGTHHGWATHRELELLVQGGLTPLAAISAATGGSARALGVDGERGTIAAGKLADLVLVAGEPHREIRDMEKIARVFLGGKEIDRERLAREIATAGMSPLASLKVGEKVDDFESADGRSTLGTLWVNATDAGLDNSRMVFGRMQRKNGDHTLAMMARMSEKERPYARIVVPLSPGAVEPVDISDYRGVSFEARGDGEYKLIAPTRSARDNRPFEAAFRAGPRWKKVKIDLGAMKRADALLLIFEVARKPGEVGWLELDNVRFYK